MKNFYLVMMLVGIVIPWYFFMQFIGAEGLNLPLFVSSLFPNGAAGGFSADVLISALVFWVWSYRDAQARAEKRWWVVLPATLLVGLSMALPLYFYLREDAS